MEEEEEEEEEGRPHPAAARAARPVAFARTAVVLEPAARATATPPAAQLHRAMSPNHNRNQATRQAKQR